MTRAMALVWVIIALTGCFDSIVDAPCASGFSFDGQRCQRIATGGDGGIDDVDASPTPPDACTSCDAPVIPACETDLATDPMNCGACGNECASGACAAGACVGNVPGHIVVIGHDYSQRHAAMSRVLANAVALASATELTVARIPGANSPSVRAALAAGMQQIGVGWGEATMPASPSPTAFDGIDVVLIEPQIGDGDTLEATAATWQPAFASLLARGRVVIVLEGGTSASYRFARGADLGMLPPPIVITGSLVTVTDGTDAVTRNVVSPYFASPSTVAFPGAVGGVIGSAAGDPVVLHLAR